MTASTETQRSMFRSHPKLQGNFVVSVSEVLDLSLRFLESRSLNAKLVAVILLQVLYVPLQFLKHQKVIEHTL